VRSPRNVLVTGGCGFIGTNFIRYLFGRPDFEGRVVNLDALTYAGDRDNLADVEERFGGGRYAFLKGDIRDRAAVRAALAGHGIDAIVHLAAETHVDRSISDPADFLETNVVGTFCLLEEARAAWKGRTDVLFHHVSTDEVYGSAEPGRRFLETDRYEPSSPYSASKAASDHLVRAYGATYGLPYTVSNCSNNYGPYQYPDKLIPLVVARLKSGESVPVYGDGLNVRDWIHADDHAAAIWDIVTKAELGATYNVGGGNELTNLALIEIIIEAVSAITGKLADDYRALISFMPDRPGHDRRYALDCGKIERELGWKPMVPLREGIERAVRWYWGRLLIS